MINLTFVLQMLKGRFYGNQLSFGANSKTHIYHRHSLHWRSATHSIIATLMCALTIEVHRVKIWQTLVQ